MNRQSHLLFQTEFLSKFFKNSIAVFQISTGKLKGTNGTDGSSFEVEILQPTAAEFILQEFRSENQMASAIM